ncbi:hypothetical protein, conserved, partial [Leishmania lindenbergi]
AARRFGRETKTHPRAPLHLEETKTPHKELSGTQPRSTLVLKLAWHSARRMGQYPRVRRTCRRLLCALLTTHHGNGAKLRGPYATGAWLPREDVLLLLKRMKCRRPPQRLFADVTRWYRRAPAKPVRRRPAARAGCGPADTKHEYLTAKHTAHAEPRAAMPCLQSLLSEGLVGARGRTLRIAPATGQSAIVAAQGTHHGFDGVGRGHWLNWPRAHTRSLYFSEGA